MTDHYRPSRDMWDVATYAAVEDTLQSLDPTTSETLWRLQLDLHKPVVDFKAMQVIFGSSDGESLEGAQAEEFQNSWDRVEEIAHGIGDGIIFDEFGGFDLIPEGTLDDWFTGIDQIRAAVINGLHAAVILTGGVPNG